MLSLFLLIHILRYIIYGGIAIALIVLNTFILPQTNDELAVIHITHIVIGSLMLCKAFFLCICCSKHNLSVLEAQWLALHIGFCVLLFFMYPAYDTEERARDDVNAAWTLALSGASTQMNALQTQYKCCGVTAATDYAAENLPIPASCYSGSLAPYSSGCLAQVGEAYEDLQYAAMLAKWSTVAEICTFMVGDLWITVKLNTNTEKW